MVWPVLYACAQPWAPRRAKQLSMAATAGVIWLCACVRYWPYRRVGTCASVQLIGIVSKSLIQFKRLACLNFWFFKYCVDSLRADEIKLWWTPSAKQRRNPCSGLPAVYPDLSTRHDWPVKKGLCFVCRDRKSGWRGIRNALPVIRWVRWGSRTRISALLRRRYLSEFSYRLHAGYV